MWNYLKKGKLQFTSKQTIEDEEEQKTIKQLRTEIEKHIRELTKQFTTSEGMFRKRYEVEEEQNVLKSTLQELISTIEGLMSIIEQLRGQYDEVREQLAEHQRFKGMLGNHQNIVSNLQESHSQQVSQIYQEKRRRQEQYEAQIQGLQADNQQLKQQLEQARNKIAQLEDKNSDLRAQIEGIVASNRHLASRQSQIELKYKFLTDDLDAAEKRKVVDVDHLKLEYIFYYGKLKARIISYLTIRDIIPLYRSNRFYYKTLKKELPQLFYLHFKRQQEKQQSVWVKNAKLYEKIFELFPSENTKTNAFKYLHFRIKPATYILPFLQEEQAELTRKDPPEEKEKPGRSGWKNWFNSEKNSKNLDRKDDGKFNLNALKSEEEFRKVQQKIESTFKNILPLSMPSDLQYFQENMERQLQELKEDLTQYRQGKTGQLEWTAQLYCLARYMYHQVGELYNLLQVIFGELVRKNKELILINEDHEYLKENEVVLRNLIENLSSDKSAIEKKYLLIENDILKKKLQTEAALNSLDRTNKELQRLRQKYQQLEKDHAKSRQLVEKANEQRRATENKISMIRQQLQAIDRLPEKAHLNPMSSFNEDAQSLPEEPKG